MPQFFGLAGVVASAFTIGVVGLTTVRRLHKACSVDDDRELPEWHSERSAEAWHRWRAGGGCEGGVSISRNDGPVMPMMNHTSH